jgi:hypothetical protein
VLPEDLMHVGEERKDIQVQFDELLKVMSDLTKSAD